MTKVKICGLRTPDDIGYVNQLKPDYAGFVFAPSKRQVSLLLALRMRVRLAPQIRAVGVFVNEPLETVAALCRQKIIDIVQLHGDEDEDYIEKIQNMTGKPVIKAFSIKTPEDVQRALRSPADYILLDQGAGGTGEPFDWTLVPPVRRPFFLAGGIGPENLRSAIGTLHPWAVDLSSSLETDGRKDRAKIQQIARMLKQINTLEAYRKEREADLE